MVLFVSDCQCLDFSGRDRRHWCQYLRQDGLAALDMNTIPHWSILLSLLNPRLIESHSLTWILNYMVYRLKPSVDLGAVPFSALGLQLTHLMMPLAVACALVNQIDLRDILEDTLSRMFRTVCRQEYILACLVYFDCWLYGHSTARGILGSSILKGYSSLGFCPKEFTTTFERKTEHWFVKPCQISNN